MNHFQLELDYSSQHKKSAKDFVLPEYLLLGGGPTNQSHRVRHALSMQGLSPLSTDIQQIMDDVKSMSQYVFQTKNRLTLATQNSGNGGNETVLTNLLDPGDKLIVAIGGTWGEKVVDMAQRRNIDTLALRKDPGEIHTLEELEAAIIKHKANLLFVTHGESTGGTLQTVEGLGAICHKHDCLLAVDAVVSIAVDPLFVDRWEVDAVTAGSQKAIGAPPGMCLVSFSPRAEKRMRELKTPPPYYFDMERLGNYWNCFDEPRRYHYTLSSNLTAGLREALAQICEEGLLEIWERHKVNTRLFWKRLEEIGLEVFVKKPENRFNGVTCVTVPAGVDQMELLHFLKDKYLIDITPGHGPTLGKAIRVGLMGINSTPEMVEYLIQALQDGVKQLKNSKSKFVGKLVV